jgi:predicted alpha/beta hydrolase family esterase
VPVRQVDDPAPTSILTLPGIHGSGSGHWQTLWERALSNAKRVIVPDWDRPVRTLWVRALERAVADAGPSVAVAAHSLGCLQIVHWARDTRLAIRGALLVAPPDPTGPAFPSEAIGFAPLPAARLPFPSIIVASADDPYATLTFSRQCATAWGGRFVDIGARGHINADSGLGEWPEGQRLLADVMT